MAGWDADRLTREVERLALRGLPRDQLHAELAARIRRAVRVDAACWHGLDPRTLLMTTADPVELLGKGYLAPEDEPAAARAVLASEYDRDDFNGFAVLARRRAPVGLLSESTRGRPERSARFREYLAPHDLPYELRVAFVSRGRAWGCVVLHRSDGPDFSTQEVRTLARQSRPIAEALRASLRVDAALRDDHGHAPGMVLLGRRNEIQLVTPPAEALLDRLGGQSPATLEPVPLPVLTVAAMARRNSRSDAPGPVPSLQVPTGGGWLSLHAAVPRGADHGNVAVVIQPAGAGASVGLELEAYGLTGREREVAWLGVTGVSTATIAEQLSLSPWTVQDHLKAAFEKTGTHSRRELRSKVFYEEYLPAIGSHAPLDAGGSLIPRVSSRTPPT
ncbi:helix-turn-helix transcriptional regulator [Nocardioides bizhenqiangii]|uniref:Helix-turn-helix transcriptional regulator n=1 Tax=Nocardioides bizhenqiangii TaxID=3095076 RepID=A0ABZ0ZW48_9ACTN|nr:MULTISPECIES: helix-turn-helix transcriptional regulator [unclassified Nocardioides]MDZ5622291.1 helix-turn-helix transcriptional regulator [Nocardioides sp. HM23]WQQ28535.1 helix-turn-helix transcriptional regulator [Nocardioides sp. HM61]